MVSTAGSPPHTRGKEHGSQRRGHFRGITPAHAGKRREHSEIFFRARDHPRTRGEKESQGPHWCRPRGSPPHTRGKVSDLENLNFDLRITPAHAGKRKFTFPHHRAGRDHPRTRGEKQDFRAAVGQDVGSPPHTRGKGSKALPSRNLFGITPAHAGKSPGGWHGGRRGEDHPRTRGEKGFTGYPPCIHTGSPPHTRGKVESTLCRKDIIGITPAHAGKRALA